MTTCENCEQEVWRYCHSQAGSLKAYAWTSIPEDSEDDQRNGVFCEEHGDWPWIHAPSSEIGRVVP